MKKSDVFETVLGQFEDEEMKQYCIDMINQSPDYIFTIPSSTTLKYHNATQCQPGGQIYHILMVCTIMNHILSLDYIKKTLKSPQQRDSLRVAACLHDQIKCGFDGGQYTVHEHPLLAGQWIRETHVEHDIPTDIKNYIARLVESHSGQWTTSNRSSVVLPEVTNLEQFLVHLSDYLGSRSDLDMIYSDNIKSMIDAFQKPINIADVVMPFGKHKGEKIIDVPMDYLQWAYENANALDERTKNVIGKVIGAE